MRGRKSAILSAAFALILLLLAGALWSSRHRPMVGSGTESLRAPRTGTTQRGEADAGSSIGEAGRSSERMPADLVQILVVDEAGTPVHSAKVTAIAETGETAVVATDAEGRCGLQLSPSRALLACEKPGFVTTEEVLVLEPGGPTVVLELAATAAVLKGRVLLPGGMPASEGFLVCAWPSGRPPGLVDFQAVADVELPGVARTDPSGRFELGGLDGRRVHRVAAARAPFATLEPLQVYRFDDFIVVETQYVYGLHVRLVDEAGNPPAVSPSLFRRGMNRQLPSHASTGERIYLWTRKHDVVPVLLGLDEILPREHGIHETLIAAGSIVAKGVLEPFTMRCALPGYQEVAPSVTLELLDDGLSTLVVPLSAVDGASGWGTLVVECVGAPDIEGSLHTADAPARTIAVEDRNASEASGQGSPTGESMSYEAALDLDSALDGGQLFTAVPAGSYRVRVVDHPGAVLPHDAAGAHRVELRQGSDAARVVIDMSGHGCLELKVLTPDGKAYAGPIRTTLHEEDFTLRSDAFERAPYRLAFLEPGTYEVHLGWDRGPTGRDPQGTAVEIRPGALTEVELIASTTGVCGAAPALLR